MTTEPSDTGDESDYIRLICPSCKKVDGYPRGDDYTKYACICGNYFTYCGECGIINCSECRVSEAGKKFDGGKSQWHLMPWAALEQVVAVLEYGMLKYAKDNWRHVKGWRWRYFNAAFRHMLKWLKGVPYDAEAYEKTGRKLHHLAMATCCLLFALELDMEEKDNEDD